MFHYTKRTRTHVRSVVPSRPSEVALLRLRGKLNRVDYLAFWCVLILRFKPRHIAKLILAQQNWQYRPPALWLVPRIGVPMREPFELVETYDLPTPTQQPADAPTPVDRLYVVLDALWFIGWYSLRGAVFALKILLALIVTVTVATVAVTLPLRWWETGESQFMRDNPTQPVVQQWVDLKHMSRYPLATVIVLEDVDFGNRALAFDPGFFLETAKKHMSGEDVDGGSTIPQQLVKNIYLSEDRSAWRKGPEALLAMTFNAFVPEARQLELYFNYAQFGPNLYGLCAASWYYFNTPLGLSVSSRVLSWLRSCLYPVRHVERRTAGSTCSARSRVRCSTTRCTRRPPMTLRGLGAMKH